MDSKFKDLGILTGAVFFITALIWLPHLLAIPNFWGLSFKEGFSTIYRNFDGLEYVIIAKTFYSPTAIASLPQSLSAQYFASHFPGYAILVAIIAPLLGFLKSMLFASLLSTILAVWAFYFLVKDFKLTNHPFFLSFLFLVLPARWVVVHSVGSSEPTFIFFIIAALYFLMKFDSVGKMQNILLASIFGMFAQITRPQGILLFIALFLFSLWRRKFSIFLFLIPLGLLGIFCLYNLTYGDFWAYFHSGDNIHLTFLPFEVFNKAQFWVGSIWLEDIIYIFLLGFLGGVMLLKQKLFPLAFFVLTYLVVSILVAHRDISRYLLPVAPFVLIAFEKVLTSREFKIILPIILLAIYLYAQNFILANTAPIPNLGLFN